MPTRNSIKTRATAPEWYSEPYLSPCTLSRKKSSMRTRFPGALLLALLFVAGCGDSPVEPAEKPPEKEKSADLPAGPALGVNYNGQFDRIDNTDLERTETTWVRGFVDFFQLYENPSAWRQAPRLQKYLTLASRGYETILNVKWNFRGRSEGFPAVGSREMKAYKQFLRELLAAVWEKTSVLVIGNEPFIESKKGERGEQLVAFYREIARTVRDFRKRRGDDLGNAHLPIYVGAFNNLYLEDWQTEATDALFAFARNTPWIAGADLHIHHGGTKQMAKFLDYASTRLREDQRMLISEFSLVKHWRNKSGETIPEAFAEEYGWEQDTKNYEYIDYALKNPVPRAEWVDFLTQNYWYENRTRYLRNTYHMFTEYDRFYVAAYAMRQSFPFNRDFTSSTPPWVLNGLFANRTVRPDPETGKNQLNYAWIEDFRAVQNSAFD